MAQMMAEKQTQGLKYPKLRIGVLASTNASDLQAVIDEIEAGVLKAEIVCLISNKPDAFCLERAKKHKIPAYFVDTNSFPSKEEYDREIIRILEQNNADLVLLIGYMKIIGKELCEKFLWRMMNIHPSLLPAFAGGTFKNIYEEVITKGVKITGCTLHFVTEEVDNGPIIAQKSVDVYEDDNQESLKERVQMAEQEILLKGIKLFQAGRLRVEGNRVFIN